MWDPYAEFQTTVLPNGLTIHVATWPGRSMQAIGCLIHGGARSDPVGLEGLAHFVEHMVSENVGITVDEIKAFFEDCGGDIELGSTGILGTKYFFAVPAENETVKQAFEIFGKMLLHGQLTKLIERERRVIHGEFLKNYPSEVSLIVPRRRRQALHSDSWFGRFTSLLGDPNSIGRVT